jgi:hypothetical protein
MRMTEAPREGCLTRGADAPLYRVWADAITVGLTRRARCRRLVCGAAVSVAALLVGGLAVAVPAAQASQRPAARTAAAYPYTFSRVAWTGAGEVIAATDKHGDLYYFSQVQGSSTWTKQRVAKGTSTLAYSKPSITQAGTTVYIVAVDGSGDLYSFTKTGSAAWQQTLVAPGGSGSKFRAPSVTAAGDGSVLISVGNTHGELVSFTLPPGDTSWTEQTVAFGTFGPSSIAATFQSGNSMYMGMIAASSRGTLYFFWAFQPFLSDGWAQGTVASPGAGGGYTGGSVTASNTNFIVAAATTTGAVDSFTWPQDGGVWTEQTVASSGGPYTSPQIGWTGPVNGTSNSYDVITATNQAGTLDYWWVADGSGLAWNPETIAANGTKAVYATPGIAVTSTSVAVTAINTKPGNVVYWYQQFGSTPWNQQLVAKG